MSRTCPSCGAEPPDQFRFCGFCGAPLEVTPHVMPVPESVREERSSRRLVTVLFADLTNYTRTAERADPEEIFLTIRRTLERLAQPVKRLGGRIDRYVGDGFLATFGIPEAHENDSVRALLAALEMQELMEELRAEARQNLGWDVQLRIGVNIGPVVSGQLDTGVVPDLSVFGHAVNLANRLQQAARPGTILVSESIYRLTRLQFSFSDPVNLHLKGMDRAVIGYEVVGRRLDAQSSRGLSGRSTPLVGRSAECEALIASLQRLKVDRQGLIALVVGEPGIGKSRLVEEVLVPLTEHFTVIRVEASPNERVSYGLLTRILEGLAGIAPEDSSTVRQQRLDELLSQSGTLAREISPVLHNLLGSQSADDRMIGDPRQEQRRIYAAARRLLAWMARRRATLLVLDDLHWADPSSLEALSHVSNLVHEIPLGLIGIVRSSGFDNLPTPLVRAEAAHPNSFLEIRLQPLSAEEIDQFLTLLLAEVELPLDLKRRIVERTSGNPLLVEEMVRMLLDQEVIKQTSKGWQIGLHWVEAVQKVPDTVNGLILSRYDRLSPALKKVLDSAAVVGQSFSLPVLIGVTGIREPELRSRLANLEEVDFIRRSSGAGVPVYYYRHWLMQEAIYQTILLNERRALHLRAAQVIQQTAEDLAIDSASNIGYHLERAQSRQAVAYLMQAAARAAARYANQEAIAYYQRVQALLNETEMNREQAVDAALGLGELLARINQPEEARAQLERARSLALGPPLPAYRLGDIFYQLGRVYDSQGAYSEALASFEAAAATLHEAPDRPRSFSLSDIEREIGWVNMAQGYLADAQAHGEKAHGLALQESDLEAVGSAHNLLAGIHYWAGRLSDSVASALEALAIREQIGDVWGSAATQSNLGLLYHGLGQWTQAEAFLRQAIFVQQEIGDYQGLGSTWNTLGLLLLDWGRFQEALHCMNQAIAVLREHTQSPALAILYLNRGRVWLRLGVPAWAASDLEKSLEAATRLKNDDLRANALVLLVETRLVGDEPQPVKEFFQQAAALAEASGSPETRAEIMRVRSRILQAERDWEGALDANRQSLELFKQLGNRYEVARRHVEISEIELARHEAGIPLAAGVLTDVREALTTFRDLHAQADIPRAEDILSKINAILAPAIPGAARVDQRPLVVVGLRLKLPEVSDETGELQEELAGALNRLTTAQEKVGREYGAAVTTGASGLTFILSGSEPEMTENLALKAVQCALEAIDTSVRLNQACRRQHGFEIPQGIGIAAGYGQPPLQDAEQTALFASVSGVGRQAEAAAALAATNQILLTSDMAKFVRTTYELDVIEDPKERRLSGPAYRVGRVKSGTRLVRALPSSTERLIGRSGQLTALKDWIDRIRAEGRGLVCYLEAEAGMGKTRLLEQALASTLPEVLCLLGKCESFRSGMSYWALVDILERASLPETPTSQQLKSLLGLRSPNDMDDNLLRNLPPTSLRQEIFGRMRDLLLQEAGQRRVMLVVEDIHWLDLSSLDLLDFLLPLTLQAPISVMLVARAEMPGPHRALVSKAERICRDRFLQVKFSHLTQAESLELVHDLLHTQALPAHLWNLLEPFVGHPLALEEALRFLVERDWLWEAGGAWHLADVEHSLDRRMPTTFKDLLLRRLDILQSDTLHVLQAAAVLGENFDRTVLSHVIPGSSISRRLAELVERGWLLPAGPTDPLLYRFKHTLTRETIYATLLTSKMQLLHQRAGEALESLYPEQREENVELLAHHFSNSSLRDKALNYLVRAGEKSAARFALAESLSYYRKAKELLEQSPHPPPRLVYAVALGLGDVHLALGDPAATIADVSPVLERSAVDLSAEMRAACLRRMGTARRKMGDHPAALDHLQSARTALARGRESGPTFPVPVSPGAESIEHELLLIEIEMAQTMFAMRENQRTQELAEHVLSAVERQQRPELAAEALNLLGGIAYRQGDYSLATRLVQDSLSLYQTYGNRSGAAAAYANLGILAAQQHDLETANDNLALSLGIREALGDSMGIAITRNNLGQLEKNRGRYAEAMQHLRLAVETARHSELSQLVAQSLANLGQVLTLVGRTDEALAVLREAEDVCKGYGFTHLLCEALWKRADCLIEAGNPAEAEAAAESAVNLAAEIGSHDLKSEAQRALGRAYRKMGKMASALEASAAAWQARVDDSDPVVRARFAAEYALALRAGGHMGEAWSLLSQSVKSVRFPESRSTLEEIAEALASYEHQRPGDESPVTTSN